MPLDIEDYAFIGDCHTGALVGNDGSIDWLCLPRFDSPSMFGALLGDENHGHWRLWPVGQATCVRRHYEEDTFVLVSHWVTETGEAEVLDFMPMGNRRAEVIRRVRGLSGTVTFSQSLRIRFDYSETVPWLRQLGVDESTGDHALLAVAGPNAAIIRGPKLTAHDHVHRNQFTVAAGETTDVSLVWYPSHREPPAPSDVDAAYASTVAWWRDWAADCTTSDEYRDEVHRSLLLLRALTHEDTGGIVAAATTSLPEQFGGIRNWDYRYVWLRDASLTLQALMQHGFGQEVAHWREWLLRAIAGDPADIQIMYGLAGERSLPESVQESLPGYRGASPVRIGNGAFEQYQGDIFGEVMMALDQARQIGVEETRFSWSLQVTLLEYLEETWQRPDNGIWEIRGPLQPFTHSRAMIWAAFDCGVRAVETYGLHGHARRWSELRDKIRHEIETEGYDESLGSFTQYYGSGSVDASLLLLSQIGFIAPEDPRMLGTVAVIERELMRDGLLLRYRTESGVDGLPGDENPFLACSFWLVQQYAASGRVDEAKELMDRLVALGNDVGMLSEEYDQQGARQVGNVPQAFSHLALVRAADAIAEAHASARA